MFPGTAGQQRRGGAERVAAVAFHVNDFRAEFGELGADVWLRDEDTRTDGPDAFERPEFRRDGRRRGPFQALDPVRDLLAKLFDPIFVFDDPTVMSHGPAPLS